MSRVKSIRRFKPWMRWTAFVSVVVAAMVIAWYRVDAKARRELEAARAAFVTHGFPTRLEEIVPPSVPEAENADALLREAWVIASGSTNWETSALMGVFKTIDELELNAAPAVGGDAALQPAALEKLVQLAAEPEVVRFAAQLQLATQRPAWWCGLDYTKGPNLLMPHVGPARVIVRLLTKHAVALAQHPETVEAAWTNLRAALIITDWIDDEPTLITYLSGLACRSIIRISAINILQTGGPPSDLQPVIDLLVRSIHTLPIKLELAMHMERLGMFNWIEHHLATSNDWLHALSGLGEMPRWVRLSDPWLTPVLSPLARPRLQMEFRECLELHLETALVVRKGGPGMVTQLRAVAEKTEASSAIVPRILTPSLAKVAASHLLQLTEQRALVVVLLAWQQHDQSKAWPATVDDVGLPADMTIDACSGQPLVLGVDRDAIVVTGFGFDHDDDGGRPVDRKSVFDGDGDIVVRVRLRK